jgi:hypothetical protein
MTYEKTREEKQLLLRTVPCDLGSSLGLLRDLRHLPVAASPVEEVRRLELARAACAAPWPTAPPARSPWW